MQALKETEANVPAVEVHPYLPIFADGMMVFASKPDIIRMVACSMYTSPEDPADHAATNWCISTIQRKGT